MLLEMLLIDRSSGRRRSGVQRVRVRVGLDCTTAREKIVAASFILVVPSALLHLLSLSSYTHTRISSLSHAHRWRAISVSRRAVLASGSPLRSWCSLRSVLRPCCRIRRVFLACRPDTCCWPRSSVRDAQASPHLTLLSRSRSRSRCCRRQSLCCRYQWRNDVCWMHWYRRHRRATRVHSQPGRCTSSPHVSSRQAHHPRALELQTVIDAMKQLCEKLPIGVSAACKILVQTYGAAIINLLGTCALCLVALRLVAFSNLVCDGICRAPRDP